MTPPAAYTEKTLAEFMHAELGKVAALLGYAVGAADAGSYLEAVNETILRCGGETISDLSDIRKARALARVEAWRTALNDLAASYRFSSADGAFERETVYRQAAENLERAQSLAAEYDSTGVYAVVVTRLAPVNDPYRYIPPEGQNF